MQPKKKNNNIPLYFSSILYPPSNKVDEWVIDSIFSSPDNKERAFVVLDIDNDYRIVAARNKKVYSIAAFTITKGYIMVHHVVSVREQHGGGSFLLERIKEFAKENGISSVSLNPLDKTIDFYRKNGFEFDAVNNMQFTV